MKGIGMKKFSGFSAAVAMLAAATLAGCPAVVDPHTNNFTTTGEATAALEGNQLYFMPDSSVSFYSRTVQPQATLPVNAAGHTVADFSVADPIRVDLPEGSEVLYYGRAYACLYIHSSGVVAFGAPGTGNDSPTAHFSSAQISLLPVDAADAGETGTVSWNVAADEITVTFTGVDGSTFQSEFFIAGAMDNDMAVTYEAVNSDAVGIVGLANAQLGGLTPAQISAFLADPVAGFGSPSDLGTSNTGS